MPPTAGNKKKGTGVPALKRKGGKSNLPLDLWKGKKKKKTKLRRTPYRGRGRLIVCLMAGGGRGDCIQFPSEKGWGQGGEKKERDWSTEGGTRERRAFLRKGKREEKKRHRLIETRPQKERKQKGKGGTNELLGPNRMLGRGIKGLPFPIPRRGRKPPPALGPPLWAKKKGGGGGKKLLSKGGRKNLLSHQSEEGERGKKAFALGVVRRGGAKKERMSALEGGGEEGKKVRRLERDESFR